MYFIIDTVGVSYLQTLFCNSDKMVQNWLTGFGFFFSAISKNSYIVEIFLSRNQSSLCLEVSSTIFTWTPVSPIFYLIQGVHDVLYFVVHNVIVFIRNAYNTGICLFRRKTRT